jgi:hypothetical protein
MDTFHLRIFQRQVADQCHFLLFAAQEVNDRLKARHTIGVMYAIQNLLNAGANISKMLWGQGGKFSAQRKPLRDSIDISDSSPLRDVTMRNHFEHMDERIDRWWAESKQHNHADMIIGSKNTVSGLAPIDTFRYFDPVNADVIFWGQDFNIQAIVDEVQKILPKLQEEINKPHWDEPALQ